MKRRISVLFLFCLFFSSVWGIDLGELKGSYGPLGENYKHLSPWWGATAWHGGWIGNVYQLGDDKEPITRVIRALFHELQGQLNITQNYSYTAAHFSPRTIASLKKMLGACSKKYKKLKSAAPKSLIKKK